MFVPRVRDEVTDITYQLDRLLGEGATSEVYIGLSEGNGPVAIKIARRGMSAAGLDAFWSELDLLQILSNSEARMCVPWAHKGVAPDGQEVHCIVIEYVPDTLQLTRQAPTPGGPIPETLAIAAGIQYAHLLATLHALKISSFGDRKATDLRWDPVAKRLIVLDWNRARAVTGDTSRELLNDLVRQDLRMFSEVWSQLMLGQSATDLPDVDDVTNPAWAHLSRGARVILSQARNGRANAGYGRASELVKALEAHKLLLALSAAHKPDELLTQANQVYQRARAETRASERAHLIEQVLTIADLAVRTDRTTAEQLEPIYEWCGEQGTRAVREAGKAADHMRRQLQLGYYPQALTIATEATGSFDPNDTGAQTALLILGRWEQIARAGICGNDLELPMSDVIVPLVDAMANVDIDKIADQPSGANPLYTYLGKLNELLPFLVKAGRQVPDAIQVFLAPVRQEIELRQLLAQATRAATTGDEAKTHTIFQQAAGLWEELSRSNPIYAERLRLVLTPLDTQLKDQSHATLLDAEINRCQQRCAESRQAILQELDTALDQRVWPSNLAVPLNSAIAALYELCRIYEPEAATLREYDAIYDLRAADDLMEQYRNKTAFEPAELVKAALERIDRTKATAYYDRLIACWRFVAQGYVRQILHQTPVWPEDLDRATALMNLIDKRPLASDDRPLAEEFGALSRELGDKQRKLAELRGWLGTLIDNVSLVVHEQYLDDLGIDQTLKAAQAAGIELFDRQSPGDGAFERQRVAALLADRQTARIPLQMKRVTSEVATLGDRIQHDWKALEDPITRLVGALQQFNQYTDFLRKSAHDEARQQIVQDVQALEALNVQLQAAKEIVDRIPEQAEHIRQHTSAERLAQLKKYIDDAQRVSQQFQQTDQQLRDGAEHSRQTIAGIWISAGLLAVRDLRLDGPDGAKACISKVNGLIDDHGPRDAISGAFDLLKRAVQHLDTLSRQPEHWHALQSWREALLRRDLATAEHALAGFMRLTSTDTEILGQWIISELRAEHTLLSRVMSGSAQHQATDPHHQELLERLFSDGAQKIQTREQQERRTAVLNQLEQLEQIQKTEDRPERLGGMRTSLDRVLGALHRIDDKEITDRYASLKDWCESRQKVKKDLEDFAMSWSTCPLNPPVPETLTYLKNSLLPRTDQLVAATPRQVPWPYWEKLHKSLEIAYMRLVNSPKDVPIPTIVWLGILYHRVGERKIEQPKAVTV